MNLVVGLNDLSPVCADSNDRAPLRMKFHLPGIFPSLNFDKSSCRRAESWLDVTCL